VSDILERYERDLRKSLLADFGLVALDGPPAAAGRIVCQVIYKPSFHPEVCIHVERTDFGGRVHLTTMRTNLWYWAAYCRYRERDEAWHGNVPPEPQKWQETAEIDEATVCAFEKEFLAHTESLPEKDEGIYCDGIGVDLDFTRLDGRVVSVAVSDPASDRTPASYGSSVAVLSLATKHLKDERSVRVLESVHSYLGLGLPARELTAEDVGGSPRTIRIYGSPSIDDKDALAKLLGKLPRKEPVFMDLGNFDGMGTCLYPVFKKFIKRAAPTAWHASPRARQHLKEIGVDERCVFSTREEATAFLRGRTG
jgi:hypothetical protein